ncbi:39S ribosomal protein L35, mitochondrial-like [Uloborus diversus]|uniref:39S ribosomal protein L35, mitochondrial-like n=1 Tax=Uloborus diversus TaxID=327109 RepID=UPI00240A5CC1|nr:39S ribosomal protein L35, mitochondrial-like [Uloborus diversus]
MLTLLKAASSCVKNVAAAINPLNHQKYLFTNFSQCVNKYNIPLKPRSLFSNLDSKSLLPVAVNNFNSSRTVTKFSLKTGKRKSVQAVLTRFYRLNSGLWIRRRAGCHKRLWRKSDYQKYHGKEHVFCTRAQCIMFDKMITNYHKKRKYYIDDPFEPYQVRHNYDYVVPKSKHNKYKLPIID